MFYFTVKVGGMRVVQHKPPSQKPGATADLEDCTGLTVNIKPDDFSIKKKILSQGEIAK